MRRILFSAFVVMAASAALAAGATGAFFSDTEVSLGNVFTAGQIDLKVDNESYYNGVLNASTTWALDDLNNGATTLHKFFDFNDVKPDDEGEDTISLHVQNDAWMCMNVSLVSNNDNSTTEPEGLVIGELPENALDAWDGELAQAIQMFWWADDGDNVYENDELTFSGGVQTIFDLATTSPFSVALADSDDNVWGEDGQPIPANETVYIAKAWCFGTLATSPVTQDGFGDVMTPIGPQGSGFTCDGTALDNLTQTDSSVLDVSFSAIQSRHNEDFQCAIPEETRECLISEEYASAAHNVDQGRRKNGTAIVADRTDPNDALGAPQSLGTPYDNPVVAGSFFALGFKALPSNATATTTPGGSIVLEFPGTIVQGPGADLKLWEVTGGTVYPDELVRVEVSNSLLGPWTLASAGITRDGEMELPIASAKYVRITDVSPPAGFETTADGFDLDAVQALNCRIPLAN